MPKYIFEKVADFNKIVNGYNISREQDKKGLEAVAKETFDTLRELSSCLVRFGSSVNWKVKNLNIQDLPHIITELPVLYPWSPEDGIYGNIQIGKIKVVE